MRGALGQPFPLRPLRCRARGILQGGRPQRGHLAGGHRKSRHGLFRLAVGRGKESLNVYYGSAGSEEWAVYHRCRKSSGRATLTTPWSSLLLKKRSVCFPLRGRSQRWKSRSDRARNATASRARRIMARVGQLPRLYILPPPLSLQRSISHSDILILRMPLLLTATEVNYRKPCKVYKSVHPSFPCARASKNANGIAGRIQTYSYWKQPQLYIHEPQTLYYRYTRSCFRCTNLA